MEVFLSFSFYYDSIIFFVSTFNPLHMANDKYAFKLTSLETLGGIFVRIYTIQTDVPDRRFAEIYRT